MRAQRGQLMGPKHRELVTEHRDSYVLQTPVTTHLSRGQGGRRTGENGTEQPGPTIQRDPTKPLHIGHQCLRRSKAGRGELLGRAPDVDASL